MVTLMVDDLQIDVELTDGAQLTTRIGEISFTAASRSQLIDMVRDHVKRQKAKIDVPILIWEKRVSTFMPARLRGINGKTNSFMITVDGEKRDLLISEEMLSMDGYAHLNELNSLGQEIQIARGVVRAAERRLEDFMKANKIAERRQYEWRATIQAEIDKVAK